MGLLHPLYSKSNGATIQTATSSQAKGDDSPNRVGIEQELASVVLTLTPKTKEDDKVNKVELADHNGEILAETNEKTFGDLPVFRLEIEGGDRGSLCIELIHGPLEMKEYNTSSYKKAKAILLEKLSKKGPLNEALKAYNDGLNKNEKRRYELTITPDVEKYRISKPSAKIRTNTQTNVAIPYSKFGQIPQEGEQGFEEMFGYNENSDKKMYVQAREEAKRIKEEIMKEMDTLPDDRHLQSLLTHVIFQEAKFLSHDIDKIEIGKEDKHHFHVMLKLSPEDAIVSILSDKEKEGLEKWLKKGEEQLKTSIDNTLNELKSGRTFKTNIKPIINQLEKAVSARDKGAKKLEKVTTDKEESNALNESGDVSKDENNNNITIRHTHPRPTNRIPVYSRDGEYYMVVEQRSAKHMLNEGDDVSDKFDEKSQFITALQNVVKNTEQKGKGKALSSYSQSQVSQPEEVKLTSFSLKKKFETKVANRIMEEAKKINQGKNRDEEYTDKENQKWKLVRMQQKNIYILEKSENN